MAEPQNYIQVVISRVAGLGAGKSAKTLIVACDRAVKEMAEYVAYLKLYDLVEILDVTAHGKDVLPVEAGFHAVLIAADNTQKMLNVGRLCAGYQNGGIPVVVITGWVPPMDARMFQAETANTGNLSTVQMFDLAADYCRGGNKGDILEFGTFQGFTLQCAYHAFNRRQIAQNRRFIAFDSFAGIVGKKEGENFTDGEFATSETSFRFSNFIAEVPAERVIAVSGPYSVTLGDDVAKTRRLLEPLTAAIVHIDCDVEAPAKLALDFVTPYLNQGSLLLFDEYDQHHASNAMGERAALRAWLRENPEFDVEPYRSYHVRARSFIVHRR